MSKSVRTVAFGIILAGAAFLSVSAMVAKRDEKYEGPKYKVLDRLADGVEIRQYDGSVIAQVQVSNSQRTALNDGFKILAGYIFGKNKSKQSISMTAPVVAQSEKISMTAPVTAEMTGDLLTMSFFMPASYSLQTLPEPEDTRISFKQLPERKLAAIRFSGTWSPKAFGKHAHELLESLRRRNIEPDGEPFNAYYNAPFTPPFFRRNEVMVALRH